MLRMTGLSNRVVAFVVLTGSFSIVHLVALMFSSPPSSPEPTGYRHEVTPFGADAARLSSSFGSKGHSPQRKNTLQNSILPGQDCVIAYSLYGDDPRYIEGALANAKLYRHTFPNWTMRVYHDDSVKDSTLTTLSRHDVELVDMSGSDLNPMNWRFLAASDASVACFCSRDVDSRLTFREYQAVAEWQASPFAAHVIRDHPSHIQSRVKIPGGMWCARNDALPDMESLVLSYNRDKQYNADQEFLARIVWPRIKHVTLEHVSFDCNISNRKRPLLMRVGLEHVGAVYLNGEMRESDLALLRNAVERGEECYAS